MSSLWNWENEKECLKAVKHSADLLLYVVNQTEEMCIIAVKKNPWVLLSVREQTPKICLEAIKQDIRHLSMVNDVIKDNKQFRKALLEEKMKLI